VVRQELAAVWGVHVGRQLGLSPWMHFALGGFCYEWLGGLADVPEEILRPPIRAALYTFASALVGSIGVVVTEMLPPPPRELFPASDNPSERVAYSNAWKAVIEVLRILRTEDVNPRDRDEMVRLVGRVLGYSPVEGDSGDAASV
jgi:hypothetical protein